MQAHQQRVIDEKVELSTKCEKLLTFLAGDVFHRLDRAEQLRLTRQYMIMQLYEQVLRERIGEFRD